MAAADAAGPPSTVLVLADDPAVLAAALAAAARRGLPARRPVGAADAVGQLVRPGHGISHVLVQPGCDEGWLAELVALTTGEAGSGVALAMLDVDGRWADAAFGPSAAVPEGPVCPEALRRGIGAGALSARVQPIVRLCDGAPAGFEILARLQDSVRGTVAPGWFVPQAERAGLGFALTEAVAARAFAGVPAELVRAEGLFLALNVPLDVLLLDAAMDMLDRRRTDAGLRAADVLLELTESQPVLDVAVLADAAGRWRAAGYRLAIDDAGPRMANQEALLRLPLEAVKFDMTLVGASASCPDALSYLDQTIAAAHRSGLSVIAEGVEDAATWERMRRLGVDQVQGFMIGRPLPPRAAPFWLREWRGWSDGLPVDGGAGLGPAGARIPILK